MSCVPEFTVMCMYTCFAQQEINVLFKTAVLSAYSLGGLIGIALSRAAADLKYEGFFVINLTDSSCKQQIGNIENEFT